MEFFGSDVNGHPLLWPKRVSPEGNPGVGFMRQCSFPDGGSVRSRGLETNVMGFAHYF